MKSTSLLAVVAAVSVLLAGCSGSADEDGPDQRDAEQVRSLERAWDVDWLDGDERVEEAFSAGDHVVVSTDHRLVGVRPDSGETSWSLPLSSICSVSEPHPESGLFAVTWRRQGDKDGDDRPCRQIGVVDPDKGAWQWRSKLTASMDELQAGTSLAIGDSTVTVITDCCYSKALRFDLGTGRTLRTIIPADSGFDGWVSTDGETIATSTGLDLEHNNLLRVYDADTGRRLWQRRVKELVGENVVAQVVSSDPLVLQTSDRGHGMLRAFHRRSGRPLNPVGPQFPRSPNLNIHVVGVHDQTLVMGFGAAAAIATGAVALRAYDLRSGVERWSGFPAAGGFSGLDADGRLVVVTNAQHADGATTVTRHATDDVDEFDVLGSIDVERLDKRFVAGDLLLVSAHGDAGSSGLTAFELPADGQDIDFELPTDDPVQAQLTAQIDEDAWQEGDVRPEDVDSCQPTKQTLRAAGFHRLDLADQFGCRWSEGQEPNGVTRDLEVTHEIATPTEGKTAVEEAQRIVRERTKGRPYPLGPVPSSTYVAVPGLGDEAHVSSVTGPGTHAETHAVVRVANVVLAVTARGEAEPEAVAGAAVSGQVVEDSALAAVRDVLAGADLDLGALPDRAADGGRSHPQPVCDSLTPAAHATIPDGVRLDQRPTPDPGRRVAGCYWGDGGNSVIIEDGQQRFSSYVKITAYAVPGSRFGRTGLQQAKSGFATLRRGAPIYYAGGQRLDGIGDQALLFPAEEGSGESKVVVRIDNVLLQVSLNDQADEDSAGQDQRAVELARQAAAQYST